MVKTSDGSTTCTEVIIIVKVHCASSDAKYHQLNTYGQDIISLYTNFSCNQLYNLGVFFCSQYVSLLGTSFITVIK